MITGPIMLAFVGMAFALGAFLGLVLGWHGKTKVTVPPMTRLFIDADPVRFGASPVLRFIKYHPSSGLWRQPVDEPTAKGMVVVQERYGPFARGKRTHYWEEAHILVLGDAKKGIGIYRPELISQELKGMIERLAYQVGVVVEQNEDLKYQLDDASRGVQEIAEERVENILKKVKELQPMYVQGKSSGGRSR